MDDDHLTASKSAVAKQQHRDRIAAVNHWRGQCLDNFARAENAIIRCSETVLPYAVIQPFKLEETAANRTRALRDALLHNWSKWPAAKQLAAVLDHWLIREKERNDLVHGCFSVRPGVANDWLLVNELLAVKKGIAMTRRDTLDADQAAVFLKAIIAERKRLEEALSAVGETASTKPCTAHPA